MVLVPQFNDIPEQYVRTLADRDAIDRGYTFDLSRGERCVNFIENYVRTTRGFGAGKPVKLLEWQHDFVMRLMSWVGPDGFRRHRSACLFIPRQQGKSFILSALSLYFLVADGEPGPDVMLLGTTAEQTDVVFGEVHKSVKSSPELNACLHCKPSYKEILYPRKNGRLKGASREGWGKLGRPPHLAVFDEYCFWSDYKPATALDTGTGSRNQSLILMASTSGTDRGTPAYEAWEFGQAILDGGAKALDFFPCIFAAKPDEPLDMNAVRKANPSIGVATPERWFEGKLEKAQRSKVSELEFRQFHLNQWTTSINQFLDLDAFHDCTTPDWPELYQLPAWVGVDMAATTDLVSVVCVVPHEGRYYVDHHSFCCRKGVERSEAENLVKYRVFSEEGFLDIHEGNCVDYEEVRAFIRKKCEHYDVRKIGFDPSRNAADTMIMLQNEGLPVEQYRQGPLYFNQPMRRLSELVLDRRIAHKGDSLLLWQAGNLEGKRDGRDMYIPTKPAPNAKIDMMVALLMGLSLCLQGQAGEVEAQISWA